MKRHLIWGTVLGIQASASFALDSCLVGTWQADPADLANVMAAQMGGTATHQSGAVTLEIAESGDMTLLVENWVIQAVMPDVPPMSIEVDGYSRGDMQADDGRSYLSTADDYALVGAADVLGTRMEIPVTTADGTGWGQSSGSYACAGDVLTFVPDQAGTIPPTWRRRSE